MDDYHIDHTALASLTFPHHVRRMEDNPFDPIPLAPWYNPLAKKSGSHTLPPILKKPTLSKPKRPLTAYNLYFHSERLRLIESRSTTNSEGKMVKGKVAFAEMARIIAKRWHEADRSIRAPFCLKANAEKLRYLREKQEYNEELDRRKQIEEQERLAANDYVDHDPYINDLARKLDAETAELIVRILG